MKEDHGPLNLRDYVGVGAQSPVVNIIAAKDKEMLRTEYAFMQDGEIIDFVLVSDGRSSLEVELAQRLQITLAAYKELEHEVT